MVFIRDFSEIKNIVQQGGDGYLQYGGKMRSGSKGSKTVFGSMTLSNLDFCI